MSTPYSNGPYRVVVEDNGYITVKPGDWISKYSSCIYKNTTTLDVFWHIDGGKIVPIPNKNLIKVGETVVHMPTYNKWKGAPQPPASTPPAKVDKKELLDDLTQNGKLSGNRLQGVSNAIDKLGQIGDGLGIAELCGDMLTLGEGMGVITAAGAASEALGLIGAVLSPFASIISLINAWEKGLRDVGIRAIAYGTTAWGFNDPLPRLPKTIENNIGKGIGSTNPAADIQRYRQAWSDSLNRTVSNLNARVVKAGVKKQALQAYIMGLDKDNDPWQVCYDLWEALGKQIPAADNGRAAYESVIPNYPD